MKIIYYIFIIFLILFSSQGNSLIYPTPLGFQLFLSFTALILIIIKKGHFPFKNLLPVIIIIGLQGISAINYGRFNLGFPSQVFYTIVIISLLRDKFLEYFIKLLYYSAIISLLFYLLLLIDFKLVYNLLKSVQNMFDNNSLKYDGYYYANIFIYSINHTDGLIRNCGFMWEPGPFSVVLSIALFFNLILNDFKLEKKSIIFIIAIISTFSTTGYLTLIIILIFFSLNKKERISKWFYLPIVSAIAVFILSLPFMLEKITKQAEVDLFSMYSDLRNNKNIKESRSLDRFSGLLLNFEDFKQQPIWGIGSVNNSIATREYGRVFSINGLGAIMSRYGIIGIILFILILYKNSKMLKYKYKVKFINSYTIIIFIQTFGFGLIFSSLYLCFLFLFLIPYKEKIIYNNLIPKT